MFTFAQKRKKGKIPKTWNAKENYSRKVSKYLGGQICKRNLDNDRSNQKESAI